MYFYFPFNLDIRWVRFFFFAFFLPRSKSCHPHTPCPALGGLFGRVLMTCEFSPILWFWGVWLVLWECLFSRQFPRTYWTLTRRVMPRDCRRHVTRGCWDRGEVWRCVCLSVSVCMYVCISVCLYVCMSVYPHICIVLYWMTEIRDFAEVAEVPRVIVVAEDDYPSFHFIPPPNLLFNRKLQF